jgi:pimeloyl-ACP methyl ester carboxylesterase
MRILKTRWGLLFLAVVVVATAGFGLTQLPAAGAYGLLHPQRRHVSAPAPAGCRDEVFTSDGLNLRGWRCETAGLQRGTLIYLHGIADSRASASGVIERFSKRGLDVVAYDSRAHGTSDGDVCTYGFNEKRDLQRILSTARPGPVILFGTSLGAAVALQAAATESRISGVIAAETFSDLRTVATERAPFFFTGALIDAAFRIAEQQGGFSVDAVSPMAAAANIRVPVLLIHGAEDAETPPAHSRRVHAALTGPKRLIVVDGAGHNESLRAEVWNDIERWIEDVLAQAG